MGRDIVLADKVKKWLNKTGFPLEMAAADAFRKAGFDVRQSSTYADPETEKGREVDVLANHQDIFGIIEISYVLECKAASKPWMVLTSPDALESYNRVRSFCISSDDGAKALLRGIDHLPKTWPFMNKPSRCGYALRQVFGEKEDHAYAAAISVLKAAHGITREKRGTSDSPCLAFAFPVIVVDAPVFECWLGENGMMEVREVNSSEFLFSAHVPQKIGACISVVKKDYLASFAAQAESICAAIRGDLAEEERKIAMGLL